MPTSIAGERRTALLPPAWLLLALVLVAALRFAPGSSVLPRWWPLSGLVLVAGGIALNVVGERQFHAAGTPMHPDARAATLVTSGVFRISRNPMYLGLVLLVLGVAVLVNRPIPLLVAPALGVLLHARFIRPEERRLAAVFGSEYARYTSRVRRWI
jgi:protein-S-isoprenylcysteine O-methyltransferase Ste14